jgi:hypothetical protein
MTQTMPHLDGLAEYPADWRHGGKQIYPGENLALPGAHLKWYDIRHARDAAAPEVSDEAREYLRAEVAAGRLEFRNELGFVLLHRASGKYIMLVCIWRDMNEIWQGLFCKDGEGFLPYPVQPGLLRPTQDVIELAATAHERRCWSRYLRSARDTAARQAYIDDVCTGRLV